MSGKSGKHNPDDVLIGFLDSPEIKAFATFVAEADGFDNLADFLRNQITERAIAHGMMKDGKAVGEWRDKVIVQAAAIRQAKRETSERRKALKELKEKKGIK